MQWSENCNYFREFSMLDPDPREVYNCHLYCFLEICIPLWNSLHDCMGDPIAPKLKSLSVNVCSVLQTLSSINHAHYVLCFAGSFQPSHALMLKFYSYFKQATLGPCNIPRPAFWDVVGKAKWLVISLSSYKLLLNTMYRYKSLTRACM